VRKENRVVPGCQGKLFNYPRDQFMLMFLEVFVAVLDDMEL
jgi:hypothetical protein